MLLVHGAQRPRVPLRERELGTMKHHLVGTLLVVNAGLTAARANIDLELRAVPEACASRVVAVDLYAVSDSAAPQPLAAADVILVWDPDVLRLEGLDQSVTYPYAWLSSGFPNDQNLDGLNNTWLDGNALYVALARLGNPPQPAWATPQGLLMARFQFLKLLHGVNTAVTMPASLGLYSQTVVYHGFIPGLVVTGRLRPLAFVTGGRGDVNCDGAVNFDDIEALVLALSGSEAFEAAYPGCNWLNADMNCDGAVTFDDIDPWIAFLST